LRRPIGEAGNAGPLFIRCILGRKVALLRPCAGLEQYDGQVLVIPASDGTMEGVDPADGRRVRRWHSGPKGLLSVAWRVDGRIVTLAQQEFMGLRRI
jgi:hypothetical protein